ncbi:hypothetical protein EUTSA_v10022060mg, partial [Eutrema salsugineum]
EKNMDYVLVNENPINIIYPKRKRRDRTNESNTDEDIKDPEHTESSLEQLKVLTEESVEVDDDKNYVRITFTPTLPHCHLPSMIGLSIYAKLLQSLPARFKTRFNKRLSDKERLAAALENPDFVAMFS